jgi:hypothetical protein
LGTVNVIFLSEDCREDALSELTSTVALAVGGVAIAIAVVVTGGGVAVDVVGGTLGGGLVVVEVVTL